MPMPIIKLVKLRREYPSGDGTIAALKDVDLTIEAGEMVAIVGASGSGKSTLMNILGCLDRPTTGSYRIFGQETADLDIGELARLRREHFGFIFQRYHLLPELTATGNVEMPAIYAGRSRYERRDRAVRLLDRLGMADRSEHRPGQLSGGQQQRASIARALMNGADIILADEPTGALDKHSGEEVLRILGELHAEGHTIIIVTHDMAVARRAERIIELSDGLVVSDRRHRDASSRMTVRQQAKPQAMTHISKWWGLCDRLREALHMALLSMKAHKLRTFLTMLGIIIGIASVVCVVALGEGAQQKVLSDIRNLGTNTIEVFPGKDFGDVRSAKIKSLVVADARALAQEPYVAGVTPTVSTSSSLRYGSSEATALVSGVGDQYFDVKGAKLATGRFFDQESVREFAQDVVIDENARLALFGGDLDSPIEKIILIGRVPCRVVGVIQQQQGGFGSSQNPSVYLPYTTVQARFTGDSSLRSIMVLIKDEVETKIAGQAITQLLAERHRSKDFFILNTDDIRRTITATAATLTSLVAAIAVISLLVGGIGVMNIMLVSVVERTAEIGVRMAVGARPGDILQQFLIEAVLVCLLGGILGIAVALGFGAIFGLIVSGFSLIYSGSLIIAAVLCSTLIGVIFGYLPARNAARLDPVVALARQ